MKLHPSEAAFLEDLARKGITSACSRRDAKAWLAVNAM
jgi:hypothetical protein